jgi:hypothetical protein
MMKDMSLLEVRMELSCVLILFPAMINKRDRDIVLLSQRTEKE